MKPPKQSHFEQPVHKCGVDKNWWILILLCDILSSKSFLDNRKLEKPDKTTKWKTVFSAREATLLVRSYAHFFSKSARWLYDISLVQESSQIPFQFLLAVMFLLHNLSLYCCQHRYCWMLASRCVRLADFGTQFRKQSILKTSYLSFQFKILQVDKKQFFETWGSNQLRVVKVLNFKPSFFWSWFFRKYKCRLSLKHISNIISDFGSFNINS